jgi:hypothetical protein
MRRSAAILIASLSVLAWQAESADAQQAQRRVVKAPSRTEVCEKVSALATGFGKENVTGFANGNLDLAIDQAKNRLADKGAKGFSVKKRNVACVDYIDFGGPIGREHKCTATAQLCGKAQAATY